jgi:hypothetical protein
LKHPLDTGDKFGLSYWKKAFPVFSCFKLLKHGLFLMRFYVLMAASVKIAIFWDVAIIITLIVEAESTSKT